MRSFTLSETSTCLCCPVSAVVVFCFLEFSSSFLSLIHWSSSLIGWSCSCLNHRCSPHSQIRFLILHVHKNRLRQTSNLLKHPFTLNKPKLMFYLQCCCYCCPHYCFPLPPPQNQSRTSHLICEFWIYQVLVLRPLSPAPVTNEQEMRS